MFQRFGIDVEFNVVGGKVEHAALAVLDPATNKVLRGVAAETAVRDSQLLSAIFERAGSDAHVQPTQVEAAKRDYLLPALRADVGYEADVVEVLAAPGGCSCLVVKQQSGG
ncbi:MAG: hypothetical protein WBM50_08565, partial [Acidimicrobiales bacterium]